MVIYVFLNVVYTPVLALEMYVIYKKMFCFTYDITKSSILCQPYTLQSTSFWPAEGPQRWELVLS